MIKNSPLIFEKSHEGRRSFFLPDNDFHSMEPGTLIPEEYLRNDIAPLPQVSEVDVVRHYTLLSRKNFGVDLGFYPLGSCTMKYNPKINEDCAVLPGFTDVHPLQKADHVQGTLELMHELMEGLCELTGMKGGTLQPFAGAHGEFTGMKLFRAWFISRGEGQRTRIIIPDSSHGTNPASAHLAGFEIVEVKSDARGLVSPDALKEYLDDNLAGIMLTNPNTLGLFEQDICEIAELIHGAGGLLYYDGANMNAIMGQCRPGDMGFDVVHLNLHKTMSTPHGGGGPGAGPVLVAKRFIPYLPGPLVSFENKRYLLKDAGELSIGRIAGFHGNIGVLVRAYTYLLSMGGNGLAEASQLAVLNANYLKEKLKGVYQLPYDTLCKHEFVLSASSLKETCGISALDVAKGLIDNQIHPPTIYFPLIVHEAMMIEPTETESKETLDDFVEVMKQIAELAEKDPESLHEAPINLPVRRVDEVLAARKPKVSWKPEELIR